MGIVVVPMPDIPAYILLQGGYTALRVPEVPLQFFTPQSTEKINQLLMHGPEVVQGQVNRAGLRIKKGRPGFFVINLDQGRRFGQGPFEPHIAVVMAVRQMMYDLSDGPSPRAVRGFQLGFFQRQDQIRKSFWKKLQGSYPVIQAWLWQEGYWTGARFGSG